MNTETLAEQIATLIKFQRSPRLILKPLAKHLDLSSSETSVLFKELVDMNADYVRVYDELEDILADITIKLVGKNYETLEHISRDSCKVYALQHALTTERDWVTIETASRVYLLDLKISNTIMSIEEVKKEIIRVGFESFSLRMAKVSSIEKLGVSEFKLIKRVHPGSYLAVVVPFTSKLTKDLIPSLLRTDISI